MAFTAKIDILRPRDVPSRYTPGTSTLDYSDPQVIPVERLVSLQPTSSREQGDNRFSVVSGWMLVTPAGMDLDLRDTDRVRHGDKVLSVVGDVAKWPHPVRPNAVHHVEAVLERVKG
ncbi:hypothetical protein ACH47B_06560 [Rhodococcus sp. NPDC019627]|uniref:hypothetical protein n=1 Tax=unclassified Rhodococcus (in: high G+C Gram-positive bacteria) TaxID=192944 RepID=UPI0037B3A89A